MKAVFALALCACIVAVRADWVNEIRLTLSNYALAPVKQMKIQSPNAEHLAVPAVVVAAALIF